MLKNDIGKFYDVESDLKLENFVELFLAMLAKKSDYIYFDEPDKKVAVLSPNYKKIIEEIMFTSNGWGIKFSKLINISRYYEEQLYWENDLGEGIKTYLNRNNKKYEYNFDSDNLIINFSTPEIEKILSKYDEEVKDNMEHFVNLVKADSIHYNHSNDVSLKESKRHAERVYIRTSQSTFCKDWKVED